MLILSTCSKDERENGFISGSDADKSYKIGCGKVIPYSPSITGDDTEGLIAAFDAAKAAGPGSTVQLIKGEYHIGFVLVQDFVGSFRGAGMGKTIIIPNMDLNNVELYNQNLAAELLKFLRGDVRISDMSFRNLDGEPSPGDDLWGFIGIHDWAATELPDLPADHKIKAVVDHVEFISHPDQVPAGFTPYAVETAIGCSGDFYWGNSLPHSTVDITITNCTVREMNWAFTNLGIEKGRMIISNNGLISTPGGIFLGDDIGGSTHISKNVFYTPAGGSSISVLDAYLTAYDVFDKNQLSDGCRYEISENIFHAQDSWGAIAIANDRKGMGIIDNKNPVQVQIKNNLFDLQGDVWAGIWNWITDDAIINNNRFTGQAKTGMYVDPRVETSLMLGNNFSKLVCTGLAEIPGYMTFPVVGDYDIILLGSNNTVVSSGKDDTSVLNMGENNKIINARFNNECKKPIGQSKADNYRTWQENWVKMRKR
jgi:hypothetical protein